MMNVGTARYVGMTKGSRHTRLGVGQMISTLAAEDKAIFFKDGDEVPVVNRTNGGHLGRQVDAQPVEGYVLRRQPVCLPRDGSQPPLKSPLRFLVLWTFPTTG